ncbi:DUF305 domain-containing protein [Streptomyces sp. NPDC004787]|uniref:DUF305 domain-containing protein n=1 Tax=Streptomyces sp. NPDC004787 TaxID=3154291 RepID=UPI0033B255E9
MADAAYGLWPLVVLNTLLFIVFAASFFRPRSRRDWRAMGAYRRQIMKTPATRAARRRTALTVAAATLVAGLTLTGCGDDSSGTPATTSPTNTTAPATVEPGAHNRADVDFAQQMIPHHRQAIAMSQMAESHAATRSVKELADQIEKAQEPEIRTMTGWLQAWGEQVPEGMYGMHDTDGMDGMDDGGMMGRQQMMDLDHASSRNFDSMFLTMMIQHHEGAVTMAKAEQQNGAYGPAKDLADQIIKTQTAEITHMRDILHGS